jgi:multicomponent Na+:H+ antiporter subunit F
MGSAVFCVEAASFVALLIAQLVLVCSAIRAKSTTIRLLMANAVGTIVILMIILLSLITDMPSIVDTALVYMCLNFVSSIAFLRFAPRAISIEQ